MLLRTGNFIVVSVLLGVLLLSNKTFAQNGRGKSATSFVWRPIYINGEVNSEGALEFQKKEMQSYTDYPNINILTGGLEIDTRSYIWHPSFLLLDLGAELNANSKNSNYEVFEDRSEIKSKQRINIGGTFFNKKVVTMKFMANYLNGVSNVEDVSRVQLNSFTKGVNFNTSNKYLPILINYNSFESKQKLLMSDRVFDRSGNVLVGRITKSFFNRDSHKLVYRCKTNKEIRDSVLYRDVKVYSATLSDKIYIDKRKKHLWNSYVSYRDFNGLTDYEQVDITQMASFVLPEGFFLTGSYLYGTYQSDLGHNKHNTINVKVNHKLFKSLITDVSFERKKVSDNNFEALTYKTDLSLRYRKKIPYGFLNIDYKYSNLNRSNEGLSEDILVFNEEHVIRDGEILLLERPYVDQTSIIVKNMSGTIVYDLNLDYIIQQQGDYVEITRVPGGQIANNSVLLIDYTAAQPGDYGYTSNFNYVKTKVTLFDKKLDVYYGILIKDFDNLFQTELLTLDYTRQYIYGVASKYRFVNGVVEYVDRNSTITPYKLWRANLNSSYKLDRYLFSINAGFRDYYMTNEFRHRKYYLIDASVNTRLNNISQLNFKVGYTLQDGQGIDMSLLNGKLEYLVNIRQFRGKCGVQLYHRYLEASRVNFARMYFRVARVF